MSSPALRRRLLAVPAALALAVGSALALATPATAADIPAGSLVVTSPAPNSTPAARTFDVTGTGTDGSAVVVGDAEGNVLGGPVTVTGGAWTVTVTFADDAAVEQTLDVAAANAADPQNPVLEEVKVPITLPAPVTTPPAGVLAITDPADGAVLPSRDVSFVGTAPAGSSVTASLLGVVIARVTVDQTGAFTLPFSFPPILGPDQKVTFAGTDANGATLAPVDVNVTLPAIPAPVIQSPTPGAKGTGTTVTFSGTGVPGGLVGLAIIAKDAASATALLSVDPTEINKPITVDADGNWSATYVLAYGNFAVTAAHVAPVEGSDQLQIISELTTPPVDFSLSAPVVVPASTGSTGPAELAETGTPAAPIGAAAAVLMMAGGALLALRRRRMATARG